MSSMVTATYPPKSTKYNQGEGLLGHTAKRSEKKNKTESIRSGGEDKMGESCVDPNGKEWVGRDERTWRSSLIGQLKQSSNLQLGGKAKERVCGQAGRKEPSEDRKERVVNQIT